GPIDAVRRQRDLVRWMLVGIPDPGGVAHLERPRRRPHHVRRAVWRRRATVEDVARSFRVLDADDRILSRAELEVPPTWSNASELGPGWCTSSTPRRIGRRAARPRGARAARGDGEHGARGLRARVGTGVAVSSTRWRPGGGERRRAPVDSAVPG